MMLSSTFVFFFCVAMCTVNSEPNDEIEGAGMTVIRKTIINTELPNNKTMVVVTVQQKTVEVQILPPPGDEIEEESDGNSSSQDSLGPKTLFGWQDLTRYTKAKEEGYNVSGSTI